MTKVGVYGTLLSGMQRHRALATSKFLAALKVPYFNMYEIVQGGYPAVVHSSSKDDTICTEIYEINDGTLEVLDGIEGFPHLYNRSLTHTPVGDVWIYYMGSLQNIKEVVPVKDGDWRTYINAKIPA